MGKHLSLRKSLACYIVGFTLLALALISGTQAVCWYIDTRIQDRAAEESGAEKEKYYLTNEQGEQLGEGTYIYKTPPVLSPKDERLKHLCDLLPVILAPVWSGACLFAAVMLFYRNRLKKPLALLAGASRKISANELDFTVSYERKDELGELCASFEVMRSALEDNFASMWRQMEERKRLNAAFAHDMRTPLTVLKGYSEMLQANGDKTVRDAAETMGRHIARLEQYADSMGRIHALEDLEPEYQEQGLEEFAAFLEKTAAAVCGPAGKRLKMEMLGMEIRENGDWEDSGRFDPKLIFQVFDNLLSNAVRYAKREVTVTIQKDSKGLYLAVADDGSGFSDKSLEHALEPYYTGESADRGHFGLGLYICSLLCGRHGGYLNIKNDGGGRAEAFFRFG